MTTYPSLGKVSSTLGLLPAAQTIQTSIRGYQFGLSIGSSLIGGQTVVGPQGYPLRQQGGTVPTATTADSIGNFGTYKLLSTGTTATFTVQDPVPDARLTLILAANPSTTIKITSSNLTATFGASSTSLAITINSSLFFDQSAIELVGVSTAAWRIASYVNPNGSTIQPTFSTG